MCSVNFNQDAQAVVCHQLGFQHPRGTSSLFPSGPCGGRTWLDNVQCNGNEESIFDCNHSGWGNVSASCTHEDDVGIFCSCKSALIF